MPNTAVSGVLVQWIIGALAAIVMALGGLAWNNHEYRIQDLESEVSYVDVLSSTDQSVLKSIRRMEQKIDWLVCKEISGDSTHCGNLPR